MRPENTVHSSVSGPLVSQYVSQYVSPSQGCGEDQMS